MRNIERAFASYIKGNGSRPNKELLVSLASDNADSLINILFNVLNNELDSSGTIHLDKVREVLQDIYMVLGVSNDVNRKIVNRKLLKLNEKIESLQRETKRKPFIAEATKEEYKRIQKEIETLQDQTEEMDNKQYEFMQYLIEEIHNMSYVDFTLKKYPNLVNAKDKYGYTLLHNIIQKQIEQYQKRDQEEILYYSNILYLILTNDALHLPLTEKRKVLEELYRSMNEFYAKKGKKNKEIIEDLKTLVELIKSNGEPSKKIEPLAKKYEVPFKFRETILEQIKLDKTIYEPTGERKRIKDYIITIDGEGAIEIDDALSCKKLENGNYLLGVHIASALGYFPYESPVIEEALLRTRSIYLPKKYQDKTDDFNQLIPMFPYAFAACYGSLLQGTPRLARSYYFEITPDGEIVEEKFMKTIITSRRKMSYPEVNHILENGSEDKHLQELIMNLREVSEILDKRYQPSRLYEQIKENTEDHSDLRVKRSGAEKIVYQPMVLTGNRVATFFAEKGYPCLYRVLKVDEEDSKKLQSMIDNLTKAYGGDQYQKLYQLLNGIYPKGWYDLSGSHDGFGLEHHCHCTSNLRRAADIVVEHAQEVCYDRTPTDKDLYQLEEEIKKRAAHINMRQDPIDWFVKDFKRAYQKRR